MTTRTQILQTFAASDTGWKGKRLFLGRWLHSGMVGNGGRWWAGRMLAVEFDQRGLVTRYQVFSDNEFLQGQDSFLLTPANVGSDDEQPSDASLKSIIGDPISTEQIERLSCWRYARVYSPATTNPRDFGLVIHLKDKVHLDRIGKHGIKAIILESDVLTVVRVVRFLRMSGESKVVQADR